MKGSVCEVCVGRGEGFEGFWGEQFGAVRPIWAHDLKEMGGAPSSWRQLNSPDWVTMRVEEEMKRMERRKLNGQEEEVFGIS